MTGTKKATLEVAFSIGVLFLIRLGLFDSAADNVVVQLCIFFVQVGHELVLVIVHVGAAHLLALAGLVVVQQVADLGHGVLVAVGAADHFTVACDELMGLLVLGYLVADKVQKVVFGGQLTFFLFRIVHVIADHTFFQDFLGGSVVIGTGRFLQGGKRYKLAVVLLFVVQEIQGAVTHIATEIGEERKLCRGGGLAVIEAFDGIEEVLVDFIGYFGVFDMIRVPAVAELAGGLADGGELVVFPHYVLVDVEQGFGTSLDALLCQVNEGSLDGCGHVLELCVNDSIHFLSLVVQPHGWMQVKPFGWFCW